MIAVMNLTNTNTTLTNCTFTANYEGIDVLGNAAPTFTNVNIDSSSTLPVRISLVSNPTFNNVQFQKNFYTALGLVNETIAQDLLWKIRAVSGRQNMPYMIVGTLGIAWPWVRVRNLASRILARAAREVVPIWRQRYGSEPLLLETLVEHGRFSGTCYRAAGWSYLGPSRGRGRQDRHHRREGLSPKGVYVYPLVRDFRRELVGG